MSRFLIALLVASATLAASAAGAGADETAPTPCFGNMYSDSAGDATVAPVGGGGAGLPHGSQAPDNLDLRGLFLNYAPKDGGTPVLTANVVLQDVTMDIPPEARSGQVIYLVDFGTVGEGVTYLRAVLNADGFSFVAGVVTTIGVINVTSEVPVSGKVFPGPMGVIQIEFPPEAGMAPGAELPAVFPRVLAGDEEVIFVSDQAPDGGAAETEAYTVKACPTEPADPAPASEPTLPTAPVTPQPAAPPPAEPTAEKKPIAKKKRSCKAKARKIKNKQKRAKALKRCKRKAKRR